MDGTIESGWRCPIDGLSYAEHPKCGMWPRRSDYDERTLEFAEEADRYMCGILVGPGHVYDLDRLFPDGHCLDCAREISYARHRATRKAELRMVDWSPDSLPARMPPTESPDVIGLGLVTAGLKHINDSHLLRGRSARKRRA